MKKTISLLLALFMVMGLLVSCGGGEPAATTTAKLADTTTAADTTVADTTASTGEADPDSLPRDETLYFNGLQWGGINDYNPLSSTSNNWWQTTGASSRTIVFETLYMYNQSNNKLYPLLADGDYVQDGQTFTIKIKEAAHWSDGEPLTANDVVYTFNIHKEMSTNNAAMWDYISTVEATDDYTVVITANPDNYNPLKILEQLPKLYILPEHQISQLVERNGGDPDKVKQDKNEDVIGSGPYLPMYDDETKVVVKRDDNYWGADASMWGSLPAPKYLAHNIFADNNAGTVALQQGEIDVSQQFIAEVWKLWEEQDLPITTYIDELPYYQCVSIPTAIFNVTKPGLDNATVRKAIAMATDYEKIGNTAMSGYTPAMNPSLMNPTDAEQALLDYTQLADLQWTGKQVDEANALLDEAGIVDSDNSGFRDIDGQDLAFKVECPTGWTDWNAALEMVAAAGQEIGLDITTYFPESATWTEDLQTANFDIIMNSYDGASISNPWTRTYQTLFSDSGALVDADRAYWNYGRYSNTEIDDLILQIPTITDQAELKDLYTQINKIYLTDVPCFGLMYRPSLFHTVYEGVWTGFPEQGDGSDIPPTICTDGYGIASLYKLELVNG